jgi:glyoxylase I family protein
MRQRYIIISGDKIVQNPIGFPKFLSNLSGSIIQNIPAIIIYTTNMINLKTVHHIAIICKDYEVSKQFYTEILGLTIIKETFRAERNSYKLDLALNGTYIIELFSFPNPPMRPSQPESTGLRHLAFSVTDIEASIEALSLNKVQCEPIRVDTLTNKRFTFFSDPDGLPLELYEG